MNNKQSVNKMDCSTIQIVEHTALTTQSEKEIIGNALYNIFIKYRNSKHSNTTTI